MTFEEIIAKLKEQGIEQETVSALETLSTQPPSELEVRRYLETQEGYKAVLEPKLHSYFDKNLTGWKEKNLKAIVDEEVKKSTTSETKVEKELRELKEELNKAEAEKVYSRRESDLVKQYGKQIDPFFISRLMTDEEETTKENIEQALGIFEGAVKTQLDNHIKGAGRDVDLGSGSGNETNTTSSTMTDMFKANNITKQ